MDILMENDRLQEALRLAEMGFRVFPLHGTTDGKCDCGRPDCSQKEAGKHPVLVKSWTAEATSNPHIIRDWWRQKPNANVAIATGTESGILVVDCDNRPDGDGFQHLRAMDPEDRAVEDWQTVKVRTGSGGYHLFFGYPERSGLTIANKIAGRNIDLRGEGGYVVAPPSANGSGVYEWLGDEDELMQAPEWLLTFLSDGKAIQEAHPAAGLIMQVEHDLSTHPGAGEGERNATLCRLVGAALASGVAPDETMRQAIAWNRRCKPPKAEAGIRKSVNAIITSEWQSMREKAAAPPAATLKPLPTKQKHPPALVTRTSEETAEEELEWLWWNRFLIGHINILAGDPGLGKSLIAVDAAARVSTGRSWPDGSPCQQGTVIYCTTEDAFASVVKPRLSAAGADHSKVVFVEGVLDDDAEGSLFLDEHMALLDDLLEKHEGQVKLLILDTLQSFVGDATNTSNNASSRRIMTPLKRLAEKHNVAVLCLEHLTKGTTQRNATYRVQGSIAFTGAARSVWIVCRDPDDKDRRIVQAGKTNLSPDNEGLGLAYTIEGEVGRPYVVWGETNIATPLSSLMSDEQGGSEDEQKSEFHRACEWLREILREPMLQEDVMAGASAEMLAEKTLRRAKKHLLIGSKKIGAQWYWMPSPTISIGSEVIAPTTVQHGQDGQGGH